MPYVQAARIPGCVVVLKTSMSGLSLQVKIGLSVVAGLVLGLGLFSWVGLQAVNITTARILDERLNRARIAAELLDENLTHLLFHLQTASSLIKDPKSRDEFVIMADALVRILADTDMPPISIMLVDDHGRLQYVKSTVVGRGGIDVSRDAEAARVLTGGSAAISNAILDETGAQVIVAATPVKSPSGEEWMLAAVVDLGRSTISNFSEAMRIGESGYAEVVDRNGVVLVRSQPASPAHVAERSDHPQRFAQLINEGKAAVRTCHRCHEENESITRKRDVMAFAPLSSATWGVALRQPEEEALAPTRQLEQRLLFLGGIVLLGISFLVWSIMQSVVRPLRTLTRATQRVAAGDFRAVVPSRRRDEIGRLTASFRTMTDELARSREELLSRNRELSVLNSIATTVSQSLDRGLILEKALERVLEATSATTGCVFLAEPGTGDLVMKASAGHAGFFNCHDPGLNSANCACYQVMDSGQTLAVNHVSQCPLLKEQEGGTGAGFVSVPLKSHARTLGVMNVCAMDRKHLTERNFKLLESIGYYVGLAVENAALYEETRRKEEQRGQLLARVITAQEEERKRISRELHDEHGQILTGVLMNLDKMESMVSPEQSHLKGKVEKVRKLLGRLLDNIRLLTVGLRPCDLDDLGLVAAITVNAEERLEAAGIAFNFDATDYDDSLPPAIETALFRIVQEAINNVIRHAQAKTVRVVLALQAGRVKVVIEDDGRGFEPGQGRDKDASLGLLGIRERTELLGGDFSITSQPGCGTRLTVEVPVPEPVMSATNREERQG